MNQRPVQRILVVDDQADVARSMAMLLEMLGFQACSASSGEEALVVTRSFRPDAVLLDIGLPDMSGHEVARRLREAEGDALMLVALTGYSPDVSGTSNAKTHFDYYLVKPVDMDALQALLGGKDPGR